MAAALVVGAASSIAPTPPGSHPHLLTSLSLNLTLHPAMDAGSSLCSLGLLYTSIPPSLFVDVYQLASLHSSGRVKKLVRGEAGDGIKGPKYWGEEDLEKPVAALEGARGGAVVVPLWRPGKGKVRSPRDGEEEEEEEEEGQLWFEVDLPLHARYLRPIPTRRRADDPTKRLDLVNVRIVPPRAIWFCERDELELPPWSPIPPRLLNLASIPLVPSALSSYDIYACPQAPSLPLPASDPLRISLPVGVLSDLAFVEPVTLAVVWVCAAWVLYASVRKRRALQQVKAKRA